MNEQEQKLLDYFRRLSAPDSHALLRYAEFMASPAASSTVTTTVEIETAVLETGTEIQKPQLIERPQNERVVDALKRLSSSYPMLEKKKLLDKSADFVAQHVMFGKPAKDVIDEIETMFATAYQDYLKKTGQGE